ncbi:hypothetical protein [Phenylobacterium sp.]|uniref:hypothetical protein n=1 Tax=Phenylobacterium sp. TaxID=1871053 RepID=UPI00273492CC|nr:hypothetical protein [Phenylobacterium sp.]MDP3634351.1 hypothetical protein [Phenylobacterium sp.]MDP3868593.1 hypothetical protein [Phenylobacterium sp.]
MAPASWLRLESQVLAQATTLAASHASSPTGRPVEGPAPVTSNLAPRRVTGHTLDIRV